MGFRITTWNVNGIRNPFQYQPWRDKRTFAAMFDILEADIVVFQETKIQRKDLRDDMVLVPGWDCYWSLPRHKKGYSGVVIYTRQSTCAPIRAEEGLSGVLCPPNSSTQFSDLPEDQQIGGYPTVTQLEDSPVDAATLDSEGRCVLLEFPAFVLIGVYSPANRDETRDEFRHGFLDMLDARIRNLVALGKRVFLTGDLNISREELDTANAESSMRKNGLTSVEYASMPARRLFNHLLKGGKVYGERDEGREQPVMWDICRGFHPERKGMFTCWEQRVNARPGNFGARIDYVLCSLDMQDWFCESNIQEGLMGSDHCPVYAIFNDKIALNGEEIDIRDIMNPPGTFVDGQRQKEYSIKNLLPLSGKLIQEFDRRRNIRDMFTRKPSLPTTKNTQASNGSEHASATSSQQSSDLLEEKGEGRESPPKSTQASSNERDTEGSFTDGTSNSTASITTKKRSFPEKSTNQPVKRTKSGAVTSATIASTKGQQSLIGFFKSKSIVANESSTPSGTDSPETRENTPTLLPPAEIISTPKGTPSKAKLHSSSPSPRRTPKSTSNSPNFTRHLSNRAQPSEEDSDVHDPIESKESWSKLFAKPAAPRCESHNEPCITLLTKKPGVNCGRSFWICARPLGPSGIKEKGTQWRCGTFIWCSDWKDGGG
ncbi:Class II abasic (AP) endonuclease [Loxospora ochrophaea]|nr:Class II abasic (AP) endonuclease [Loxospora ochrophaea]